LVSEPNKKTSTEVEVVGFAVYGKAQLLKTQLARHSPTIKEKTKYALRNRLFTQLNSAHLN
jgi:hypothetical protein